jgi:LacI family transcriptional regulator
MKHLPIGLVIGTEGEYHRRVLRGISQFAHESGQPWLFSLTPHDKPDLRVLADWHPVGIIAHLLTPRVTEQVLALGRPVVNVASWISDEGLPHVGNDNAAIGRAGAEHLLERHFRHFAFVGWPGLVFSDQREGAFAAALRTTGHECACYREPVRSRVRPQTDSPSDHEHLRRWLAGLPTPVAVMACNDVRAWQVLQIGRELGRHVPDEMAVLGADNDEAWCLLAHPPLSSVAVAAERVGYLAAAKLARMLRGQPTEARTAVPPLGVVTRPSSDTLAIGERVVAEAVRFIRQNAGRPLSIEDVLEAVPVSRRALERAFRRALGRSPAREIRQAHLRRAKDLLGTTELDMGEVAYRSGFTGPKQLSVVFRQHTGLTPTAYRQQFRARPGKPAGTQAPR